MKGKYCKFGIVVSVCVVILGVLILTGQLGGNTEHYGGIMNMYESGAATLGSDFYTYVNNNATLAGYGALKTANNLDEIGTLLKNVLGYGFIALGLISFCAFGAANAQDNKNNEQRPMDFT